MAEKFNPAEQDLKEQLISLNRVSKTVKGGRIARFAALMVVGVLVASMLKADSIFTYIQKMQLYVSPGVVAVFAFGLVNRAARLDGLQIGLFNIAETGSGVQIGVWNSAQSLEGLQIGFGNVNADSSIPFFPVVNFAF